jgi:hypothetical protein
MNHDEEQVLLCAGRIADLSLRLVGGRGLNGRIIAVGIDDFSTVVSKINTEAFRYSRSYNRFKSNDEIFRLANAMVRHANNFCRSRVPLSRFSCFAKELRAATEAYNDYIFNKIKAES